MALLDIAVVRRHLRILHDDEDADIIVYQAAAESIVVDYIDREVIASGTPVTADGIVIAPSITAAILLLIGDLYENREAYAGSKGDVLLPRAVRSLLAPYRIWRKMEEC